MNAHAPRRAAAVMAGLTLLSATLLSATLLTVTLLTATLLTATASAGPPSVSASVSADSVQVVEPFSLNIRVQADQGARVAFPELQNKLGQFEIREVQDAFDVPHVSDASLRTWTRSFTLESIETGDLQVPPLSLQVTQAEKTSQLTTQPIAVRVVSVLEDRSDPSQFRDIQTVVDIALPEPRPTRVVPWTALAVVSLLAVALSIGLVAYRRRGWITPHIWATNQIDALNPDGPNVANQLSQILREFLMLLFEMSGTGSVARGRPAQEIIQTLLDQHMITASIGQRLSRLFDLTDQVKFAGLHLSPEETTVAIATARELVAELATHGSKRNGSRHGSGA